MTQPVKKFRRARNRTIAGVCAGIADYFDIDVVLVRLIYFILTFFTAAFPGILIYLLCWIVVPTED